MDVYTFIHSMCQEHPQILIFLSLAIGYFIGKLKFFGFKLGSTASVLLTALVLGQLNVTVTPLIKAVSFALFIFTIGYKAGPHFFGGLKKGGLQYVFLAIFVAVVGLITALLLGKLFSFDQGTTAGLLAGAMTQSSVIGTAEDAIKALSITAASKELLTSNIAIAYAITYIFGVAGLILFYKLVPKLLKLDLKKDAQRVTAQLAGGHAAQAAEDDFNKPFGMRMYQVTNKAVEDQPMHVVQGLLPKRVVIEKIKRGEQLLDPTHELIFKSNDIVLLVGNKVGLSQVEHIIGPEVDDATLISVPTEVVKISVSKPQAEGKPLGRVLNTYAPHCFISIITHHGKTIPLKKNTIIYKDYVLHVVGLKNEISALAQYVGQIESETYTTNVMTIGLGCFLGTLLGLATIKLGSIPLTLGIGGGILLLGLFFGWLGSTYGKFGSIPQSAQWLLTDLGLNLFIACVGLTAGPKAIHALETHGPAIFFAGVALTLVPHTLGLIFGRLVLKMDYLLLLGGLTGAGTATPSLNVLKNESDSMVPVLGYTVPYAIGNFILTIWGTIIVNLM